MTARSVIDVDVDTAKWSRFQQLFDKYTTALDATPNTWKAVGKEQAAMASQFERMTAAMMAQAQQAREEVEARSKEERHLTTSDRLWRSISTNTKSVAGNVIHATTSLLKWTGILTGVTGLLGGGALFGLDKLAGGLGNERRTAMGLGMTVGQNRAFNLDFSRAIDTEKFLGDVQEMMTNPAESGPLWRMGINPNGKTADVANKYLESLRKLAVSTPTNQIGFLNTQYGTSLSTPEWMRLHDMSAEEFGKMRDTAAVDKQKLEVNDPIARKWQEFAIQLDRAGMQIKNIFEIRLAKLEPRLEALSEKFVHFAEVLANSGFAEKALSLLIKGLDWLSKEISSPQFEKDVKSFVDGVGKVASAISSIATFLGSGDDDDSKSGAAGSSAPRHALWGHNAGFLGAGRVGENIRKWFDTSVLGKHDDDASWDATKPLPSIKTPAPISQKGGGDGLDLSNIVGGDPTAWNASPITNSYASRSTVNNTTNNYGARGGRSGNITINIVSPPGFSVTTSLGGLTAGIV